MPDSFDLFAAELAFGLLDGSERGEAESLRLKDRVFAARVAKWNAVAEAWLEGLPDHAPSPELWDRVTALIARLPDLPRQSADDGAGPVALPVPVRSPGAWRPLAIAAGLLACLFAGLWASRLGEPVPVPTASTAGRFSVAQIGGTGKAQLATVFYDRAAGTLTVRIAAIAPAANKAPELWLIDGPNPPHSLGFGQSGGATRMQANAPLQRSLVDGAVLAITLEPMSRHPHAAPSSKILGTGTISTL